MLRRVLAAGAAAAIVLGVGAAGPATPARASTVPSHVGIRVAGIGTACADAGSNGLTLLSSRFDVTVGQPPSPLAGLVLYINGVGNSTAKPDYWAYWYSDGSRWVYSSRGPAYRTPPAGSVEAWAFGQYSSSDQPPVGPPDYPDLCGAQDPQYVPVSQAPAPAPRTSAAVGTSAPQGRTRAADTPAGPGASAPRAATGPGAAQPASSGPAPRSGHAGSSRASAAGAPTTTAGSGTSTASSASAAPSTRTEASDASGSPAAVSIAALLAVVALGGGAFWRMRRQRLS